MGRELSDELPSDGAREPLCDALLERRRLLVGLSARGEKVPWPQGPSWASLSRAVDSEEATLVWLERAPGVDEEEEEEIAGSAWEPVKTSGEDSGLAT